MDFDFFGVRMHIEDIVRVCAHCETKNPHQLLNCTVCGSPLQDSAQKSWAPDLSDGPERLWTDPADFKFEANQKPETVHDLLESDETAKVGTKCSNPKCGLENMNVFSLKATCPICGHRNFHITATRSQDGIETVKLKMIPDEMVPKTPDT